MRNEKNDPGWQSPDIGYLGPETGDKWLAVIDDHNDPNDQNQ
jgi:hypothetical protein